MEYADIDELLEHLDTELESRTGQPRFRFNKSEIPMYADLRCALALHGRKNLVRRLVNTIHEQVGYSYDRRGWLESFDPNVLGQAKDELEAATRTYPAAGSEEVRVRRELLELLVERIGLRKRKGSEPFGRKLEVEHSLGMLWASDVIKEKMQAINRELHQTVAYTCPLHDAVEDNRIRAASVDHQGYDRSHPAYYFVRGAFIPLKQRLRQRGTLLSHRLIRQLTISLTADSVLTKPEGTPWDEYTTYFYSPDIIKYHFTEIAKEAHLGQRSGVAPVVKFNDRMLADIQSTILIVKSFDVNSNTLDFPNILTQGEGVFPPTKRSRMLFKPIYFVNEVAAAHNKGLILNPYLYESVLAPLRRSAMYFTIAERTRNLEYMLAKARKGEIQLPKDYLSNVVEHFARAEAEGMFVEARHPETDSSLLHQNPWLRIDGTLYAVARSIKDIKGENGFDPRGIHEVPPFPYGRPARLFDEGLGALMIARKLYGDAQMQIRNLSLLDKAG